MINDVLVEFDTVYQSVPTVPNLNIKMVPANQTPNTVGANLHTTVGVQLTNNTRQLEGELLMIMKNTLYDIDFEIDDDGNLIVHAPDADNYSIDDEGFLIYTYR